MSQSATDVKEIYSSLGDDPDLAEIVEMFVDEMPDRASNLTNLFESQDMEELGRAAHQLKGAAGSYGFDQITPFAAHLESAVRGGNSEAEIREILDQVVEICGKVRAGTP